MRETIELESADICGVELVFGDQEMEGLNTVTVRLNGAHIQSATIADPGQVRDLANFFARAADRMETGRS